MPAAKTPTLHELLGPPGVALRLFESPFLSTGAGRWLISADETGILRCASLLDAEAEQAREFVRARSVGSAAEKMADRAVAAYTDWFEERLPAFTEALLPFSKRLPGPAFARPYWRAVRAVPPGALISYGEAARRAGRMGAPRTAGTALRVNPVLILTPCHRVVPAESLSSRSFRDCGGFAGAKDGPKASLKRSMIVWEAVKFPEPDFRRAEVVG